MTISPELAGNILLGLVLVVGVLLGLFLPRLFSRSRYQSSQIHRSSEPCGDDVENLKKLNEDLAAKTRALEAKELELTLINKRLQKLEEAKSKFVAVTTHQLRTPLSAIKWTFNMLQGGQLGALSADEKTFVNKGSESTERMIKIVNDLLKVDQIEAERKDYQFTSIQLEDLVESVIFEFENQAESKKIEVNIKKPARPLPTMEADAFKLRMVLENLIDNAIKYNHYKGRVEVILSDENINTTKNTVEITIADTGIGIPTEEREKIFSKFFRATNAVAAEPDGSGLGLYLSRDIIEKHGGTLWFETGQEGTRFHISLPLHQRT
jgi:hypothetical protein